MYLLLRRPCLWLAAALLLVTCGDQSATPLAASKPAPSFTTGQPALGALPDMAQPLRAVFTNSLLMVLASSPTDAHLSLYEFDPRTRRSRSVPLAVDSAGLRAGLGVDDAGTVWVGVRDRLLRIDPSGHIESFATPPVIAQLPERLLQPQPSGAPNGARGFVTSLGIVGDRIALGRAESAELLVFDRTTRHFQQWMLPAGTGDIGELVVGPNEKVTFSIERSGIAAGVLNDRIGIADPKTGVIKTLDVPSRGLSASGGFVAAAGASLRVFNEDLQEVRPAAPANTYDARHVALRIDGSLAVRVNASHELAIIDVRGRETRRIEYAVPLVALSAGPNQPYNAPLAFLTTARDDSIWFALLGRPEIYQLR